MPSWCSALPGRALSRPGQPPPPVLDSAPIASTIQGMNDRPNVLFISIDDLRPELGCYGCDHIDSPHLDALALESMLYSRAFCQVPVCGASRASTQTGARPRRERFIDYWARADEEMPEAAVLPEHLRRNGYHTVSRGKVLHTRADSPQAWCEPAWRPAHEHPGYRDPDNVAVQLENLRKAAANGQRLPRGPAWEMIDGPESQCPDHQTADYVIQDLDRLAGGDQPFFLAAGFVRPHLPFSVPRRYFDRYDRDALPMPACPQPPSDVPDAALHRSPELRLHYEGIEDQDPLSEPLTRSLRHGYFAAVSFLDEQIGRVLTAVDRLGLRDDTIVAFTVDHGWNLGEHALWCKHCLYETSLRVPLMLRVPGRRPGRCDSIVDNLDIYPTFCELLDLPEPEHGLDGHSLVPTLEDPGASVRTHSQSRYHLGRSVRTDRYRYSRWEDASGFHGHTLFDHAEDPDEANNLANDPTHAAVVAEHLHLLPGMD